jgi:sulfite reductase alpha subunit-like flavoprotein
MARDVHDMLEQVYAKYLNRSAADAADFFKQLRTKRRYQVDVW